MDESGHTLNAHDCLSIVEDIRSQIADLGMTGRHRVGIVAPQNAKVPLMMLALTDCVRVLPVNPALSPNEITALADSAQLDVLIVETGIEIPEFGCPSLKVRIGDDVRFEVSDRGLPPAKSKAGTAGLLLLTSGSTGNPKTVPLDMSQLILSAHTISQTLKLSPSDRALHALPMFHIGALVDLFLAPMVSGGGVVFCPQQSPQALARGLKIGKTTWMQLVPTMLARCLSSWSTEQLADYCADLRFVRSVSADLAPDLQVASETGMGGVPVIQIYGLTETAGQVASNPLPPAARKQQSVGRADGAMLVIVDSHGNPVENTKIGEVCVQGPTVTSGYEGADRNDSFFGDWFRTGDLGYLDADGYLFLTGRKKEMINRGGEKISPVEIERAALTSPNVMQAASFALPHPTLGEQVGLAVVLKPDCTVSKSNILEHLRSELAEYKMPRDVQILDEMPRLGSGKTDKLALIQTHSPKSAEATVYTARQRQIAQIWQSFLQGELPRFEDDFFDSGGDSLIAAEFLVEVEKAMGRTVSQTMLYDAPTFGGFVQNFEQSDKVDAAPQTNPVLEFQRQKTLGWKGQKQGRDGLVFGLNLLAQGHPIFFCSQGENQPVQARFGGKHPIYTMRSLHLYPNRTDADCAFLADRYCDEINALQPEGALVLVGLCAGADIFDLVARRLEETGREVRLFVSLDYWFSTPTQFPVIHGFSRSRRRSAAMWFHDPTRAFAQLHPNGALGLNLACSHAELTKAEFLDPVIDAIKQALSGTPLPIPQPVSELAYDQRETAWSCDFAISSPRFLSREAPGEVRVCVTNTSAVQWDPNHQSGLGIAVHLKNLDGFNRCPMVYYQPLDRAVASGQKLEVTFALRYPATGLPLMIAAEMIDEGYGRFGGALARGNGRMIWANPFTAKQWQDD